MISLEDGGGAVQCFCRNKLDINETADVKTGSSLASNRCKRKKEVGIRDAE